MTDGTGAAAAALANGQDPAAAAAAAGATGATDPTQTPATKWFEPLDAEIRNSLAAAGYDRLEGPEAAREIGQAYHHLQKRMGTARLTEPPIGEPDKLKTWEGWTKLGVPETPDKYDIKKPDKLPEGMQWNEGLENRLRQVAANDAKLAPFQVQAVVDMYGDFMAEEHQRQQDQLAAATTTMDQSLRESWGANYAANKDLAVRAFAHFANEIDDKAMIGVEKIQQVAGDPFVMLLFQRIGAAMGEAGLKGKGDPGFDGKSAAQAKAEWTAYAEANRDVRPGHARYPEVQARLEELSRVQALAEERERTR
jgi:hypothetical protein